jgi:hypothetical protein
MSQKIVERAREIAIELLPKCECRGTGQEVIRTTANGWLQTDPNKPCPSCARLREIAEWKWHTVMYAWQSENLKVSSEIIDSLLKCGNIPAIVMGRNNNPPHYGLECACGAYHKTVLPDPNRQNYLIARANPTFTIPQLRELLQDLGLWDNPKRSFRGWLIRRELGKVQAVGPYDAMLGAAFACIDIIADTERMTEAVENFLKLEVEG